MHFWKVSMFDTHLRGFLLLLGVINVNFGGNI